MKIKFALISLYDKSQIKNILEVLKKYKIKIISSGGTYEKIKSLGYKCIEVSEYTNFPEILDGRVKTLHPKIHSGILFKRQKLSHKKVIKKYNIKSIDLVITNFYPFKKVLNQNSKHNKIIENIDIGGPTLVRSAAKNYNYVTVITKIEQYKNLIDELNQFRGSTTLKFRREMSREAFGLTASYDSIIYNYFNSGLEKNIPNRLLINAQLIKKLRYGENPHQVAAIYSNQEDYQIQKLQGKELSYNNYKDIFACLNLVNTLPKNKGTIIVKHANPSGVSIEPDHLKSYLSAINCDPVSAFGGILACNYKVNFKIAKKIIQNYYEVIIADGYEAKALNLFKSKKNLRLIDSSKIKIKNENKITSGLNSFLLQSNDDHLINKKNFKFVSKIKPPKNIIKQLVFALNVCRSVKSNSIVITQNDRTLGIGSGQPNRLDSCKIAINKMKKFNSLKNKHPIIAASDAFFPFIDGIEKLVQAGVSVVIQPYGSVRDKEIINYANKMGIALVFSKTRHFNH